MCTVISSVQWRLCLKKTHRPEDITCWRELAQRDRTLPLNDPGQSGRSWTKERDAPPEVSLLAHCRSSWIATIPSPRIACPKWAQLLDSKWLSPIDCSSAAGTRSGGNQINTRRGRECRNKSSKTTTYQWSHSGWANLHKCAQLGHCLPQYIQW